MEYSHPDWRAAIRAAHWLGRLRWQSPAPGGCVSGIGSYRLICIPGNQFICIPGNQFICIPGNQFICIPGNQFICIPGNQFICIPGNQFICIPDDQHRAARPHWRAERGGLPDRLAGFIGVASLWH